MEDPGGQLVIILLLAVLNGVLAMSETAVISSAQGAIR